MTREMIDKITPQTVVEHPEVVLSVEQISKKFCRDLKRSLFYGVRDIASELTGGQRKSDTLRNGEFWALEAVSFQLRRGEALGLVGSNGAGKSTLLRIISGLIKPDTGRVRAKGRLAPLIALGAGFNPILTGKENIYANMSILGLTTKEIKKRFDEVVDFAEIWEAIDAPVQTYSSGMAARLGFACAVHIEPDILLIDEVLAVGDIKFKMKCHQRLAQLREQGTAFILVSHNPYHVLNVCENSIYLQQGKLLLSDETHVVIRKYEEDLCLAGTEKAVGKVVLPQKTEAESFGVDIVSLCFKDEQGNILETLMTGQPAYFCLECKTDKYVDEVNLGILISLASGGGERVLSITSTSDNQNLEIFPGNNEIQMQMPYCGLLPGIYTAKIYLKQGVHTFDKYQSFRFIVKADQQTSRCLYYQPRIWKATSQRATLSSMNHE